MKFRIGVKERLYINILLVIVIVFLTFSYFLNQIKERDTLLQNITENNQPSLTLLYEIKDKFTETGKLINYWSQYPSSGQDVFQEEFNDLFVTELNSLEEELTLMSDQWGDEDHELLRKTLVLINDSLYFSYHKFLNRVKLLDLPPILLSQEINFIKNDIGIIFLASEIEQNLDFLIDKRNLEIDNIYKEISIKTKKLKNNIIILSFIFILLVSIFSFAFYVNIKKNITLLTKNLSLLTKGKIPENIKNEHLKDFHELGKNLNKLFTYIKNLTILTQRLRKNDFSTKFNPFGKEDELGNSIVNLQENLRQANEEQNRYEKEEKQRKWVSESIAKINDILRLTTEKTEDLGYKLIKEIISLTNSSVGGIFIVNNEDKQDAFIELVSAYAYDRRKNLDKIIKPGEGLIGRCVEDKELIYLTDVPEDYLSIKSGLGENKALCLLIVPLQLKDKIFGVIELASFHEIEDYKIKFVETIGENIATSFSNLKNNIQTAILLEQMQQQAEELLSQEEEMRQNMEELRATQEKSAQREELLKKEIEDLNVRINRTDN